MYNRVRLTHYKAVYHKTKENKVLRIIKLRKKFSTIISAAEIVCVNT